MADGTGGLGELPRQLLNCELSLFHYAQAAKVIDVMLLSIAVNPESSLLRSKTG